MGLSRPQIQPIGVVDADHPFNIYFSAIGGSQIIHNQVIIYRNDTQQVVLNQKITSFSFVNTIKANVLTNGVQYKVVLTTFGLNNVQSFDSDAVLFWCFNTPSITIPNIVNGQINNQTYNFQGSYTGANTDTLQSYRYILYDSNQITIQSFSEIFNQTLLQQIAGNENGITYYIELLCVTQHGGYYTSGKIKFIPNYIVPRISGILTLTNQPESASVSVLATVTETIGKVISGTISYIDNEYIDLKTGNGVVSFKEGFSIDKNFTMKIYLPQGLDDNVAFLKLNASIGYIIFKKYDNRIHAFCYIKGNSIVSHFVSNILVMGGTDNLVLWIQRINDNMNLEVAKI